MQKRRGVFILIFFFCLKVCYAQGPLVKQWDRSYGGSSRELLTCLQQTKDGGYILGGYSFSTISGDKTAAAFGNYDYWIVKIDSLGNKQWDKDFGGLQDDYLFSIQQTRDGGYIIGGTSTSGISGNKTQPAIYSYYDYWVVKIDSLGNKQWDKDFGGTEWDQLYSVEQANDGGYILGGYSYSDSNYTKTQNSFGYEDYWIVKIDSLGNKQWDKEYGGTSEDILYSLKKTKDGGYILGGVSYSGIDGNKTQNTFGQFDYWIVKIDSLGNKQWDKDFGGDDEDYLYSLQQTRDGGYVLGGFSLSNISGDKTQASYGGVDYWIVKIDSLGNKQWDKDFGGSGYDKEHCSISQTSDGGYIFSGPSDSPKSGTKTENNLGQEQIRVIKMDSLGYKQWDKTILTAGYDDTGLGIQTKDGCYVFADYTSSGIGGYKTQASQGYEDYWIIKFFVDSSLLVPLSYFISSDTIICMQGGKCIDFLDRSTNNPTTWQWHFSGAIPDTSTQQNPTGVCYSNPGTYNVTLIVSNAKGRDTLTVSPMIIVGDTSLPTIFLSGDTLTSSHASAYQWFFNGFPVAGATDSFYVATMPGNYAVQITDGLGCTRLSAGVWADVSYIPGGSGVGLYPNPTNDKVTVQCKSINTFFELSDVTGKVLMKEAVRSSSFEIDLSRFSEGIYFITVYGKNGEMHGRVVKN